MPSMTVESVGRDQERAELQAVLQSPLFARTPALSHLLSYLCEKTFAGESEEIKEYSVALDVFDRRDSFDQDSDSIVRVQANRLRKRLSEYYASDGAVHPLHITVPVGGYVPVFERVAEAPSKLSSPGRPQVRAPAGTWGSVPRQRLIWMVGSAIAILAVFGTIMFLARERPTRVSMIRTSSSSSSFSSSSPILAESGVGLPVGDEVRILAGATRKYVDHAGKVWSPDSYFKGGSPVVSPVQHIWRTQDPIIYRISRQGDFAYNIPLKPGTYELHLHFAETFYGPEDPGGGGEGSRIMTVHANGEPLLTDYDVLADSGGDRTAEVKVFAGITPAADGQLHLSFSSLGGGSGMLSAIEILPGISGHLRPVRLVARDAPYYSNDSHWWSADVYFKGGQLRASPETAVGTDDPEFYETERWGHFSYAIPAAPGRYTVTLHFIDHQGDLEGPGRGASPTAPNTASKERLFNVFCNGKTILANLDILKQAGENRPLVRKIKGLQPNAQGKLLLDFVPVTHYATVTAIEVVPE